jgi:hypothetical protein
MAHAYNAHFWSYPDVFSNDYSIASVYITTHCKTRATRTALNIFWTFDLRRPSAPASVRDH